MSTNSISIGGRVFKVEPSGMISVSRRLLQGEDLRNLPPDTTIGVNPVRTQQTNPIELSLIMGPGSSGFEVMFEYCESPGSWRHALAYSKFNDAAKELLIQAQSVAIYYDFSFVEDDGFHHVITMDRPEFKVEDIEAAVELEIGKILDPLTTFVAQLDQQVKQQFHV